MFDHVEPGSRPGLPVLVPGRDAVSTMAVHKLETEEARRRLSRLEQMLDLERQRQAPNRYQMALDDDFYDGLQFSEEDAQALINRGQAPLVYNKIAPTVRWVTGTEKRTRIDFKVYPRSDDDAAAADAKTKLLKYVQDVNKSAFARSMAFADAMRAGVGWLEGGVNTDPTEFIVYDRWESWRNVLYDSFGQDPMQRDWRYMIRQKVVDTDIATLLFQERRQAILSAASYNDLVVDEQDDEWYLGSLLQRAGAGNDSVGGDRQLMGYSSTEPFNRRSRVKLYEMWYRWPTRVYLVRGGSFDGQPWDRQNDQMVWERQQGASSIYDRVMMKMRCAVFVRGTLLQDVESPYRHNRFPFTPIWGNRRQRDGMPYGMVRNLRDPQEDFNKRMSKALFAISTRRIITEQGAVDDWEELRAEAARPDALIVAHPGKKIEMKTDLDVAQHHVDYARIDAQMIQEAAGVTDDNLGRQTNAKSGIAIERRQDQGALVTADYFDNLRLGQQLHGEKQLALVEQYVTMPMQVRILGERQGYDFMPVNWQKTGQEGQPEILNDITATQADFIIGQQDFRDSVRQAAFEELMSFLEKIATVDPMFVKMLLDDVLEMSNIPGKENIVATIREITGKQARDKRLSPEEQQQVEAAKQQKAQEEAAAKALQLRGILAEIKKNEAQAAKLEAEAMLRVAEAQAEGQDQGQIDGIRAQYEEERTKLQQDTAKLVMSLREKVTDAQRKAADNAARIASDERIAREEIASRERIAADRATTDAGVKRDIAGVDAAVRSEAASASAQSTGQVAELTQLVKGLISDVKAELREIRLDQRDAIAKVEAKQQKKIDALAKRASKPAPTRAKPKEGTR